MGAQQGAACWQCTDELAELTQAGDAAARLGDHAAALQVYTEALQLCTSPALPTAGVALAAEACALDLGAGEVSTGSHAADSRGGREQQLRLRCADCCGQLGRLREAVAQYGAALELTRGSARAAVLLERAAALEALERYQEAAQDAAQVLALSPGHRQVRAVLAGVAA